MSALASPCSAVLPLPALPLPLQSGPELIDSRGRHRKIVRGKVVGVQGQVSFDPFEARDDACERAHVFPETCNCGPRRNGSVSPLVMTSLLPALSSTGTGARLGSRSFLRPQLGHCGRAAT